MFPTRHKFLFAISVLLSTYSMAEEAGDKLQVEDYQTTILQRRTAMPDLKEGRLAKILMRYYEEGLGGPEHWEKISSLKVAGTLKLEDNEFEMAAYQKKPDLIKMTIFNEEQKVVLGYDGKLAWTDVLGDDKKGKPMSEIEARRFIHHARFGNYLLYPHENGKKIAYVDTVPVEGNICHQIRVTLDSGYQIDYFIDIRTYLEIKVVNLDLESGQTSTTIYTDYFREFGVPIAKQVETYEDGEWVSTLTIHTVKVNAGVIPWMFKMRSE